MWYILYIVSLSIYIYIIMYMYLNMYINCIFACIPLFHQMVAYDMFWFGLLQGPGDPVRFPNCLRERYAAYAVHRPGEPGGHVAGVLDPRKEFSQGDPYPNWTKTSCWNWSLGAMKSAHTKVSHPALTMARLLIPQKYLSFSASVPILSGDSFNLQLWCESFSIFFVPHHRPLCLIQSCFALRDVYSHFGVGLGVYIVAKKPVRHSKGREPVLEEGE